MPPPPPAVPLPSSLKKLSALSLEPEDAITLRARVVRFKHFSEKDKAQENSAFDQLHKLVGRLSKTEANEKDVTSTLRQLADHFNSLHNSVSSFELLQSGIVDAVLQFATDSRKKRRLNPHDCPAFFVNCSTVSISKRRELLLNAFAPKNVSAAKSPLFMFVKKLQESLTRIESFDVVTVTQGLDGLSDVHFLGMVR